MDEYLISDVPLAQMKKKNILIYISDKPVFLVQLRRVRERDHSIIGGAHAHTSYRMSHTVMMHTHRR